MPVVEYNVLVEKQVPSSQAAPRDNPAAARPKVPANDILRRIGTRDISRVTRQLATLLRAGMPLVPALTALVAGVGDGPKVYNIRLGTARQRDSLPPKKHIWFRSAQSWLKDWDALEKIETQ